MRDVHVHRVLIENTVEDRILALQEKKRDVINNALDEDKAKNLSRLGREELIFLFVSYPAVSFSRLEMIDLHDDIELRRNLTAGNNQHL